MEEKANYPKNNKINLFLAFRRKAKICSRKFECVVSTPAGVPSTTSWRHVPPVVIVVVVVVLVATGGRLGLTAVGVGWLLPGLLV